MARAVPERTVVLLIGAVQFVNVLEFMMVAPLGPDFARDLGIPLDRIGDIVGSYSVAGALSGLGGALFLDRFDRRKALALSMVGLVLGTLSAGLATGYWTLLAARLLAGVFGGPATALAFSIVADVVPAERRGRAMGTVMSAFSVASILGMPFALRLALYGGWRLPFLTTSALGGLVATGALLLLPPMREHLAEGRGRGARVGFGALLRRTEVRLACGLTSAAMLAGFLVIPNLSAYVQGNLGFPRSSLDLLYTLGGVVSLVTLRVSGRMVDRLGSFRVGAIGAALLLVTLLLGFLRFDLVQAAVGGWAARLEGRWLGVGPLGVTLRGMEVFVPVLLVFFGFYVSLGMRNVANTTLISQVPRGAERARLMSLQSFFQHLSMSLGSITAARLLDTRPGGGLGGLERVVVLSVGLSALVPVLMWYLERQVRKAPPPPGASTLARPLGTPPAAPVAPGRSPLEEEG